MKASELINQLQNLVEECGDLPVEIPRYDDLEYQNAEATRIYTYCLGTDFEYPVIMIDP